MMFPPDNHAPISPSRLQRIIDCPGSFRLAQKYDSEQSSYAAEGSMLHGVLERYLASLPRDPAQWPQTYNGKYLELDKEQEEAIADCYEYLIQVIKPLIGPSLQIHIEKQVYLSEFNSCLYECYGTCDIVITTDNQIHVIDWKFGKGVPVYVENNDQLYAYLSGACVDRESVQLFEELHVHLVQPRLDIYDHIELTSDELLFWIDSRLVPGVNKAFDKHAPFNPGQKQCRWCPARIGCRARFNFANQTAADIFGIALKLHDDEVQISELTVLLQKAAEYEQYIKDIKSYLQNKIQQGEDIDGWKMVHGRSIRRWKDEQTAEMHLGNMFDYDQLYNSKFISPTQAEKLQRGMKKEDWFLDLVEKPDGKPTLVPDYDKRQAINYRTVSEIFQEVDDEE